MESHAQKSGDRLFLGMVFVSVVLTVAAIHVTFLRAPVEAQMGIVQKIFYFHVPSAYAMYLGALACFVGSTAYLVRATDARDSLARAGAEVAVVFGVVVLITGPLWAAKAWGQYWTWDPRLTTSLLSFLIYVAYLILRAFGADGESERKFAAALGFLGAINLPIIHYSVQKWSGQHPTVVSKGGGGLQHPDMKTAFVLAMLAFTGIAFTLLWSRLRLALAEARVHKLEQAALELGLREDD